ncbi:MAG: hypothetical protein NT098_06070 [Candidatus Parcubacteria bacterium]|nr:hypothetical protein [Candidatus Parcubacteria bacterium]
MDIIYIAFKILNGISSLQQKRYVKYVPYTGNIYIYRNIQSGVDGLLIFSQQVEILSGAKKGTFIECELTAITKRSATFKYTFEESTHSITVNGSRIVIVD